MSIVKVDVNPAHVSAKIRSVGSATFDAAGVALSLPVGFDLKKATRPSVDLVAPVAGIVQFLVEKGNEVELDELVAIVTNADGSGESDIRAGSDGIVVFSANDGETVEAGKSVGWVKTPASGIPAETVRNWGQWLQFWTESDTPDLLALRELAAKRVSSLFALPSGHASIWQTIRTKPEAIANTGNQEAWDNMLEAVRTARSIPEAKKAAKAVLSGQKYEAPKSGATENLEEALREAQKRAEQAKAANEEPLPKPGEKDEATKPGEPPKSDKKPKTDEEVKAEEALQKAKSVRFGSATIVELCDDLSKLVGNAQDAPNDELSVVTDLLPILSEMDQAARLVLIRALMVSIARDA